MKKFLLISSAALFTFLVYTQPAHALFFSDFVDFDGVGLGPNDTGSIEVNDSNVNSTTVVYNWLHDITDNIGGNPIGNISISDAKLTVSYRKTADNESWTVKGDSNTLGTLTSTDTTILTTDYSLLGAALTALQSDGKSSIDLFETTNGTDKFRLYESTLSGNYTVIGGSNGNGNGNGNGVVPEPSSLLLMGSGLFGLMGYRLSRRRRA